MLQQRVTLTVVAETLGVVASGQGPHGVADAAIDTVESTDVLLVPGGWGTRAEVKNEKLLAALRRLGAQSRYVSSVCTGSALLAQAGLLDGKRATSNKRAFDWVVTQGPRVEWVRQARWVEDGNCFTSSGVSAGMDMTLALIERIFDRETALSIAYWAEYTWHQDSTHDPFVAPREAKG